MIKYLVSAAITLSLVSCAKKPVKKDTPQNLPVKEQVAAPAAPAPEPSPKEPAPILPSDPDTDVASFSLTGPIGGPRPVDVKTPLGYSPQGKLYPLLILLHGFNTDGESQDTYLGLSKVALERGYIFIAPNGTTTLGTGPLPALTTRFWDATKSCCNFTAEKINDVAYISGLIQQMIARYPVDPKRVYLFGHSNGAFMAHRMACEVSTRVTAIAALAGSLGAELSACKPKVPVSVLTIHGVSDPLIQFNGGQLLPDRPNYPSALETIGHWAKVNACAPQATEGESFSIIEKLFRSPETKPLVYQSCAKNGAAELWQIADAGHIPKFNDTFVPHVLDFFDKHQRKD